MLWIIEGLSDWTGHRAIWLGVQPRTAIGLIGIFFSPLIHGDYEHLLSNTLPLLVVGSGLIFFYKELAWSVIAIVWLFSGSWVWIAARNSSHIGASGLIYGFVFFLFFSGILRKDVRLMAVSMLVTFLYGSMVWGILPIDQTVSWESHLMGSIAGMFCAFYFRKEGPQKAKTQWEIDEEMGLEEFSPENPEPEDAVNLPPDLNVTYTFVEKKSPDANEDDKKKPGTEN